MAPASNSRGLSINRKDRRQGKAGKKGLTSGGGLGLGMKTKGRACSTDQQQTLLSRGNRGRGLKRGAGNKLVSSAAQCDTCDTGVETYMPTVAQLPDGYGVGTGGRRISTGIINDLRGKRGGHGYAAGDCGDGGCGAGGCGAGGCGVGGKLCHRCGLGKVLGGAAHPYGGAVPHTNPVQGQSGLAPSYAYPYYTTRGPRDFLRDNPPSIGY